MICVFSHIEKCAGTSLTTKFRNELPFRSCDIVSKGNIVSKAELRLTKLLYPRLKIISGHNLSSGVFDDIAAVFGETRIFTVIREPIQRLVSNYLHDKTRGAWDGDLHDYQAVVWKQNYLSRFIGGGDVNAVDANLKRINYFVTVKNLERLSPLIFDAFGLDLSKGIARLNTLESNQSDIPADLAVAGGVNVGKHLISPELHATIVRNNALDIALFHDLKARELTQFGLTQAPDKPEAAPTQKRGLAATLAHGYRNAVQKPAILRKFGYATLPRNAVSPDMTAPDDAFK